MKINRMFLKIAVLAIVVLVLLSAYTIGAKKQKTEKDVKFNSNENTAIDTDEQYKNNTVDEKNEVVDNENKGQPTDTPNDTNVQIKNEEIVLPSKPSVSNGGTPNPVNGMITGGNNITNTIAGNNTVQIKPNTNIESFDDSSLDIYWQNIYEIAASAQRFYTEYFGKTRLISKNGYLYNKAAETFVDINYLCDNENLSTRFFGYDYRVLLMSGSDLATYSGLTVGNSDMGLTVFVSYKHPTDDKYLIASANNKIGIISGTGYRSLLGKYSQSHGAIKRLSYLSDEYDRILKFISIYESKFEEYYVRSIYVDNKYAMVTLSNKVSTADVKQYILVKDNNFWEVAMDGVENEARLVVAVNKKLPDFNIDMLPGYVIHDYKGSLKTDFSDVLQLMIVEGYVSGWSEVSYIAGTDNYCYAVTNAGAKYLVMRKDNTWDIKKVDSSFAAAQKMLNKDSTAPIFILLDD